MNHSNFIFRKCFKCFQSAFILFSNLYFSGYDVDEDKIYELKNEDFLFLSTKIESNWKRFARQLNIKDTVVTNIGRKCSRDKDGFYNLFENLKARDGSVKVNQIKMVCEEIGVSQEVLEYLTEKQRAHENV